LSDGGQSWLNLGQTVEKRAFSTRGRLRQKDKKDTKRSDLLQNAYMFIAKVDGLYGNFCPAHI
jgi:hypothetical protein